MKYLSLLFLFFTCSLLPADKEIELTNFTKKVKLSFMEEVRKQSVPKDFSYSIPIKDNSCIKFWDICPNKHLLATYHDNHQVKIWDLTSGKFKNVLTTNPYITALAFHPYVQKLVIAEYKDTQPKICLWDVCTSEIIVKRECNPGVPAGISVLKCSSQQSQTDIMVIAAFVNEEEYSETISQWLILEKEIFNLSHIKGKMYLSQWKMPYKVDVLSAPINSLIISKTDCDSFFYCQQAIKLLTAAKDSEEIKSSPEYKSLTEKEKEIIDDAITKKNKINS